MGEKRKRHLCPYWKGYFLLNPLRKLLENPFKIMGPYVKPGMSVLEIGPGMGFFTIPVATILGPGGKLVCVEIQEKMIAGLKKRAKRAHVEDIIEARLCSEESLGIDDLKGEFDLAIAFHVAHEVPDQSRTLKEIYGALKESGKLFLAEPSGHVSIDEFEETVKTAKASGFNELERPLLRKNRTAVFIK